jgi:phage terminase large subunit-like protein
MNNYLPYPKQVTFHESAAKGRLFLGGNRSGKTTAGVMEDLWWITKRHPYHRIPAEIPIRGRAVGSDFTNGIGTILLPEFKRWVLPSMLINGSWDDSWNKEHRTLTLEDDSFIEFRSTDQELVKHAGTSRHFVHFDEEPPSAYFVENLLRIADVNGNWWITMTPVDGMTWVYDDIYVKWQAGDATDLLVVEVESTENPFISVEGLTTALGQITDEDEKAARMKGTFLQKGGLVYKDFSVTTHVVEPVIPSDLRGWNIYTSVDHGVNNPTAWLWHAVSPEGRVVTFHEHYQGDMTIKQHSEVVKQYEAENGLEIFARTGDPAMKQRNGESGMNNIQLYALEGINIGVEGVPREVSIGVNRVRSYLKAGTDGKPMWTITENCQNLIKEIKRLHWKTFASSKQRDNNNPQETIQKKDDHAADSARYFFTLMPELVPGSIVPQADIQSSFKHKGYVEQLIESVNNTVWTQGERAYVDSEDY